MKLLINIFRKYKMFIINFFKEIIKTSLNNKINIENSNIENSNVEIKKKITISDTSKFILKITEGQVIKIANNYSFLIAATLPFDSSKTLYRFIIKFNNIDIPNRLDSYDENSISKLATNELTNLLLNKIVTLKNLVHEKYDIIYADVYLDELCVNDWLITEKFAIQSFSAKPTNWLVFKLTGHY